MSYTRSRPAYHTVSSDESQIPLTYQQSHASSNPSNPGQAHHHEHSPDSSSAALGKPGGTTRFNVIDLLAIAASAASAAVGVFITRPASNAAWHLGYGGQLILVGLFLSIQNLALRRLTPITLATFEARLGRSGLQNYEAILRNSAFASHVSVTWRGIIVILTALPIALSAAYKSGYFRNGNNIQTRPTDAGRFGIVGPPGVKNVSQGAIGVSYFVNASIPFMSAASNDSEPPKFDTLPQAYGFNTLLLSNTSVALLDAITPDRVTEYQQNLSGGAQVHVTAKVNATVVSYNDTIETRRDDKTFWNDFNMSEPQILPLFNKFSVLFLANELNATDETWCFLGVFEDHGSYATDGGEARFRNTSLYFNMRRAYCMGTWTISATSVELTSGSCNEPGQPNNDFLANTILAPGLFFMPTFGEYVGQFRPYPLGDQDTAPRAHSPWLVPTFTATVGYAYWARMAALESNDTEYSPGQQLLVEHQVMNAGAGIYAILALQPALTALLFISTAFMHDVPVGRGFGLVAILAGIDRLSIDRLRGASLSGQLKRPAILNIRWQDQTRRDVKYTIGSR
ncbi:MAG: hypothetical protein Q9162_005656 [Coniocarpon cinnabarinum]